MRLPGQITWSLGIFTAIAGPRSYEIKVGSTTYRRNRRHLVCTNESPTLEDTLDQQIGDSEKDIDKDSSTPTSSSTSGTQELPSVHRSQRDHGPPCWMKDYVPL